MKSFLRLFIVAALSLSASFVFAQEYVLKPEQSSIQFVSVKNNTVPETHNFKQFTGKINAQGEASVVIQIASLETHIEIRNERMRDMLFHTAKMPTAEISVKIPQDVLAKVAAGDVLTQAFDVKVTMHQHEKKYATELRAVALKNGEIQVTTVAPLIINAADFGLDGGIEALREIAKLSNISLLVPVTATLVYQVK